MELLRTRKTGYNKVSVLPQRSLPTPSPSRPRVLRGRAPLARRGTGAAARAVIEILTQVSTHP